MSDGQEDEKDCPTQKLTDKGQSLSDRRTKARNNKDWLK